MLGMPRSTFAALFILIHLQQSRGPYAAVQMAVNRLQAVHLTVSRKKNKVK